ncbi:MAG: hypothetical protein HY791_07875 [Deltaproteobacteria bacterium]|nr:hypothetical protein [Deltaproteobacteria bacterium]
MSQRMTDGSDDVVSLLDRPLAEASVDDLVTLFAAGAKQKDDWRLGLEIEVTPFVRAEPKKPIELPTLLAILDTLAERGGFTVEREGSLPTALKRSGEIVTVEPGGQIELATKPFKKLRELLDALDEFARLLAAVGNTHGYGFWAIGRHPYNSVESSMKLPKARYKAMREYMGQRERRALDMMHLTGSVQCAVDFSDEANMVAKIRTAAKASPFVSALAASSPFSLGKPNGLKSDRMDVWMHTDGPRSGLWPEMFDEEGLTFRRYVERALRVPAMFFVRDGRYFAAEARPFVSYGASGFGGSTVTVRDFVDHLTSLFPEIRIKNYLELRGADCLPPVEAIGLAGIWRAILDDEATRHRVDERLKGMDYESAIALQPLASKLGLAAISSIGPVAEVVQDIAEAAYARFATVSPDCAMCMVPLLERAREGRSISDELLIREEKLGLEKALELVELKAKS